MRDGRFNCKRVPNYIDPKCTLPKAHVQVEKIAVTLGLGTSNERPNVRQSVHAAKTVSARLNEPRDGRSVFQIERYSVDLAIRFLNLRNGFGEPFFIDIANNKTSSFSSQAFGDSGTDAGSAACNDDPSSGKSSHDGQTFNDAL